jgi:RND superfamily putative drug exporter
MAHRRQVILGWLATAIAVTAIAGAVGRQYANNFSLPGTDSQRAVNLLQSRFPAQSGDLEQVVWHVSSGTVSDASTKAAIEPLLAKIATLPHVTYVVSPYGAKGSQQVSANRQTAFATVGYDKRANLLPDDTGNGILDAIKAVHAQGLSVAAGGQVIEDAESKGIGFATGVGVLAALVILFLTFGSLVAAGMPMMTAGFGLVTGIGLIGLMTHVVSTAQFAPELAVMIGLGVGIDYALFITTRFREAYGRTGDVDRAVLEAMDTSGRAVVLAGTTVIIALLGMLTLGVSFLNGVAVAAAFAVLLTLAASLTVLPAMLSRFGERVALGRRKGKPAATETPARDPLFRRWAGLIQRHPWISATSALAVLIVFIIPVTALRLDSSDASNDPSSYSSRHAYDMLAAGFGKGFNGPLSIVAELPAPGQTAGLAPLAAALKSTPDVSTVLAPRISPDREVALLRVYPTSAPEALATTNLVNNLRKDVIPPLERRTGEHVLVGGFTAGAIDFSRVLGHKLPLFIGVVVLLSALLLLVIFRSLVIPVQAAIMNLLSIGGALGVVTALFQWGWLGSLLGVRAGPIEGFVPVMMFAIVFGLSMDYEVFLISRVHEEWVRGRDASRAVLDGLAFTGRVITAAAAIMVCVFLSFLLGDERVIKEFGLGLGGAIFLDAVVVRCLLLPAVLEILGERTWWLPESLARRLPRVRIEGSLAGLPEDPELAVAPASDATVSA